MISRDPSKRAEILTAIERDKHRQTLNMAVLQMVMILSDVVNRLDATIRNELGSNASDGAFARLREEIKAIEFNVWRAGKEARRKDGL